MSDQQLSHAIHKASDAIDAQERQQGSKHAKRDALGVNPVLLFFVALLVYGWVSYDVFIDNAHEARQDLHQGAVNVFMRSDEAIRQFYQAIGALPSHMPNALVHSLVIYEALGDTQYSLTGRYPPYDVMVVRDVTQPLDEAVLSRLLMGHEAN
jgi:hypothetical protein